METNNVTGSIVSTKQTVPESEIKTGTIATEAKYLIGTGTLFLTECKVGSWVWNGSSEICRVESVVNDTLALLNTAFSTDIPVTSDLNVIDRKLAQCKRISLQIPSGDDPSTWNGQTFTDLTPVLLEKTGNDSSGRTDFVNPVVVNTSDTVKYIIQY